MKYNPKDIKNNLLLIFPPEDIIGENYYHSSIPYGIGIIKAYLKGRGYERTTILDLNTKQKINHREIILMNHSPRDLLVSLSLSLGRGLRDKINPDTKLYQDIKREIREKDPQVVGISVVFYFQLYYSILIARIIKMLNSDIYVVMGGPLIEKNIDHLIYKEGMEKAIDGFVVGPGEVALESLLNRQNNNHKLSDVPNFYYLKGSKYVASKKKANYPLENLKIIPEFNPASLHDYLPIRASIGCYWAKCTFCSYCLMESKYMIITPEDAVELIKKLIQKYKKNIFHFVDDMLPPEFLKKFSEILLKEKIKILWTVRAGIDMGFADECVPALMKRAGCYRVHFGIESMAPRILKLMNKRQSPDDVYEILGSFKKAELPIKAFVIFGFPSETKAEANITLNFLLNSIKKYSIEIIDCEQFVLEEGTAVFNNPEKFGIEKIDKTDKGMGLRMGFKYTVKHGMTQAEAKDFVVKAYTVCSKKISSVFSSSYNQLNK